MCVYSVPPMAVHLKHKKRANRTAEIVHGLNKSNPANKEKIDIFLNKVCTVYPVYYG